MRNVCLGRRRRGTLIPHGGATASPPGALGIAVIGPSFRGPAVPATGRPARLAARRARAVLPAIPVPPVAGPAQLKGGAAALAVPSSEFHSKERVGTRQRAGTSASSLPRRSGSTPRGDPVAAGSPVSPGSGTSLQPTGHPRHFLTYVTRDPGSGDTGGNGALGDRWRHSIGAHAGQGGIPEVRDRIPGGVGPVVAAVTWREPEPLDARPPCPERDAYQRPTWPRCVAPWMRD